MDTKGQTKPIDLNSKVRQNVVGNQREKDTAIEGKIQTQGAINNEKDRGRKNGQ